MGGRQTRQKPRSGRVIALLLFPQKHKRQPHLPSQAGSEDGTEQLEAHGVQLNDLTRGVRDASRKTCALVAAIPKGW